MKKIIQITLLLMCIIIVAHSCKAPQRKSPPGTTYIYRLETPSGVTVDSTEKLISHYLGEPKPEGLVKSDENIVYFASKDDLNTTFEQDLNTGSFAFNKNMQSYMGDYVPKLPSQDEAVKIAEAFMKRNQVFPHSDSELKIVHKGGLRSQSIVDGKQSGQVVDKLIILTYGRVLDSLPVIGPGSKIIVKVGDKGEVMGMTHRWREFIPAGKQALSAEALISQEEATVLAKQQIASEYGAKTPYTIKTVSKAYYDNNGKVLQPVFVFETIIDPGQDRYAKSFNYLCVIPMLKNSPEPLQLISVDPKAKELIRTRIIDQKDSTGGSGGRTD